MFCFMMVFVYVMSLRVNRRALEQLWERAKRGALEQLWERAKRGGTRTLMGEELIFAF